MSLYNRYVVQGYAHCLDTYTGYARISIYKLDDSRYKSILAQLNPKHGYYRDPFEVNSIYGKRFKVFK